MLFAAQATQPAPIRALPLSGVDRALIYPTNATAVGKNSTNNDRAYITVGRRGESMAMVAEFHKSEGAPFFDL